jgi:hypothetical protein
MATLLARLRRTEREAAVGGLGPLQTQQPHVPGLMMAFTSGKTSSANQHNQNAGKPSGPLWHMSVVLSSLLSSVTVITQPSCLSTPDGG